MIVVSITDTGLGIPPSEQTTIFDEFHQGTRTTSRGYGGLGLGLAVCRLLVEMHGGRIWAESSGEEGAGSTFTFTLPVLEEEEGERERGGEGEREKGGAVLVLAERTGDMDPLLAHLVRQGFAVETTCIDEGSDWLSSVLAAPPRAVVLDLGLAAARGWEILKALKENPATRDVPVLFASLEEEQDGGAVLEMDYLTKPIGTSDLARALERQGIEAEGGKTILVVDDEAGVREMHARVVRAHLPRCRVLEAGDGREALEMIQAEQPDLVLLDLMMPEMDGFGVLEAMQEGETTRAIPVIVLTGRALTGDDVRRLNRGVTAVLGKGLFSAEETLAHVTRALRRDERTGSETQQIVRRALAYVHQHYAEPISPETLAAHVGVSKRHLSRCFRQEMDLSPGAYLNRYRVRQARVLLETGAGTVTEVGLAVGFSDGHYFGRVFRREVGVSPGAYRRGERAKGTG